VFNASSLAFNF